MEPERRFSTDQIARLWATTEGTIRRLFEGKPGVTAVPHPAAPKKKKFMRLEISESAVERTYAELTGMK